VHSIITSKADDLFLVLNTQATVLNYLN